MIESDRSSVIYSKIKSDHMFDRWISLVTKLPVFYCKLLQLCTVLGLPGVSVATKLLATAVLETSKTDSYKAIKASLY